MRKIQCIIKVTNGCNLRCKYCYNAAKKFKSAIIPLETVEKTFSAFSDYDCIQVIFHGGEPMLAGLDFYEKVLELEKRVTAFNGVTFENLIQTNATLIDKRWLNFFKKHKFAVGISFDGIYNDAYRGETQKVLKSIELLKKEGFNFGSIAVVTDPEYDLYKNYEYFKTLGITVDFSYVAIEGGAKDISVLDSENYTKQMVDLFDKWIYDREGVAVRNIDFMIKKILKCNYEYCTNGSCIGNFYCVDVDGSLYGCSMESAKKYCFGNISEFSNVHDVINSENFKRYISGSIERRKKCAASCAYFDYCKGGCTDNAITNGDITSPNKSYCKYFTTLFTHIKAKIDEIFQSKADLSNFNPHFKRALMQTTAIDEKGSI
ncbi:MAG: radical SAM protein [Roseburia sp.]|nr:radical SAM protein [Roseburia sp.]